MLTISIALAAAAALYLAIEWRSIREPSLLFWSAGFATITLGSTLALLRSAGLLLVGIWFTNGLLVVAHWCFLLGVALSEMIRSVLPEGALAARLGGDEFVVLLRNASNEQIVGLGSALREQFHHAAAQAFATPVAVTLSIGANLFDHPPASLAALIEQGDAALYQSKRGGRDSIRLVDQTFASH
jgi:hypothetical protein